jgi:hypothetical protein
MNAIPSSLPPYDAALAQSSLSRSLRAVSERARPSVPQSGSPPDAGAGADAAGAADARAEVTLQNQIAALGDPVEAAAENKLAASAIGSSPADATAVQGRQDADSVRRLVSED